MFKDEDAGDVKGYHSFKEVAKDIDALVDLVWVSGTRMCPEHQCINRISLN